MILLLLFNFGQAYVQNFVAEFITDTFEDNQTQSWSKRNREYYSQPDSWVTDCGIQKGHRIFGGYLVFRGYILAGNVKEKRLLIEKTFTGFPPHWSKKVKVKIFKIDSWNQVKDSFSIFINDKEQQKFKWTCCNQVFDICGSNIQPSNKAYNYAYNDQIYIWEKNYTDSTDYFKVLFDSDHDAQQNQSWGFREFYIIIDRCHPSCLSCSGPNSNNCLSCGSDSKLNNDNRCICQSNGKDLSENCQNSSCTQCRACLIGQYLDSIQKFCTSCNIQCSKCSQATVCTQCITGFYLQSQKCKNCNTIQQNCIECLNQTLTCTKCDPKYELTNGNCIGCDQNREPKKCTQCLDGYFLGNEVCNKCYKGCKTCTYSGLLNCTSCITQYFLIGSICIKKCPYPKFGNNDTSICQDKCPDGTAGDINTRVCHPCHPKCLKCGIPYSPNLCYQCVDGVYLDLVKCVDDCPPDKIKQTFTLNCLDYRQSTYNKSVTCNVACQPGTFFDEKQFTCVKCNSLCFTCHFHINPQTCTYCYSPLWFHNGNCVNDCPEGLFKDQITQSCSVTCQPSYFKETVNYYCAGCDRSCKLCTDETIHKCSQCNPPYQLFQTSCLKDCSPKYFDQKANECVQTCIQSYPKQFTGAVKKVISCSPCYKTCKKCTGQTNSDCQQCKDTYTLLLNGCYKVCEKGVNKFGQCLDLCQLGYFQMVYPVAPYKKCQKCHQTCFKCSTSGQNGCTQCQAPNYLQNTTCVLDCSSSFVKFKQHCLSQCPDQFYNQSSSCKACTDNCITCKNNNCQKCKQGMLVKPDGKCGICPLNYGKKNYKCQPCQNKCSHCKYNGTIMQCLICQSPYLQNGKCITTCSPGKYPYVSTCQPCPQNCSLCLNNSYCTQCTFGSVLIGKKCYYGCPLNTYYNGVICQNCTENCKKCTSDKCSQCYNGFRIDEQGKCQKWCQLGKLNPINNYCEDECQKGFYIDNQLNKNTCKPCHLNCLTCNGSHFDKCIKCKSNRGDQNNMPLNQLCNCWEQFVQNLDGRCIVNKDQKQLESYIGIAIGLTYVITFIVIGVNRKRILLYKFLDFCQTMGGLLYLNIIYPHSIAKILQILNLANFSPLYYMLKKDNGLSISTSRILLPAKFEQQGKTQYFLYTSLLILIFTITAWILVFFMIVFQTKIKQMENGKFKSMLLWLSCVIIFALPIQIFLRTFFDLAINMCLQFSNHNFNDTSGIVSFALSVTFLIYTLFMLVLFFYKIDFGKITNDNQEHEKFHSLIYQIGMKQSKWSYIWTVLICVRKLLIAIFIVFIYQSPVQTGVSLLMVNLAMLIYTFFFNPYSTYIFRIFNFIIEFTNTTLCVILLSFILDNSGIDKQSDLTGHILQAHIIMQIAIQMLFIFYYLVLLIPLIKRIILKCFGVIEQKTVQKQIEVQDVKEKKQLNATQLNIQMQLTQRQNQFIKKRKVKKVNRQKS